MAAECLHIAVPGYQPWAEGAMGLRGTSVPGASREKRVAPRAPDQERFVARMRWLSRVTTQPANQPPARGSLPPPQQEHGPRPHRLPGWGQASGAGRGPGGT